MMLRNACESLRPGGYFIGTTIDANQLVLVMVPSGYSHFGQTLLFFFFVFVFLFFF